MNNLLSIGLTFFKKTFLFSILLVTFLIIIEPQTSKNFKIWKYNKENYFVFLTGYKSSSLILNVLTGENRTNSTLVISKPHKKNLTINSSLECPLIPENLNTRIVVNKTELDLRTIENELKNLPIRKGGFSSPVECKSRNRVALIVPFRDRDSNLKVFLNNLHRLLVKQQLDYGIFLVEPIQNITFNRGLLMNIGFIESLRLSKNKWDCFIFHDVDLIPEDERNIYVCSDQPRHMSSSVSTFDYKLPYDTIFGGVCSLNKSHVKEINGFSNIYFGWGGEDDDLRQRLIEKGFKITRYPLEIGRYLMVDHEKDKNLNTHRFKYLQNSSERISKDGLSSISYQVLKIQYAKLFTKIIVNYNQTEIILKNNV